MKLPTPDIFIYFTVLSDTAARSSKHLGSQNSSGRDDLEQVDCNISAVMNVCLSTTNLFHFRQLSDGMFLYVYLVGWLVEVLGGTALASVKRHL